MKNLKIEISPDVLSQEVSGETVLLDIRSESYFGLDPVGTRIWELLQENGNLASIHQTMLAEFDVESDKLEADLIELIGKLEDAGLVSTLPV
jgi:hypothetical protein